MKNLYASGTLLFIFIVGGNIFAQNYTTISAFEKSLEKEKSKDYTGAIKAIADLKDSVTYEVVLRLGWLNFRAGLKKKSLAYYEKAINMMPRAIEPRLGFGFPAYELENFSDLIVQDKKILEIDPNNKITNSNLGHIYYYDKQYKNALTYLLKVAELYPFDYDNNLLLGWTYLRLKQNTEAEKYFKITLMYSPDDASVTEGLESMGEAPVTNDLLVNAFSKSIGLSSKSDYIGAINALKDVYDKSSYYINLRLGWLYYLTGTHNESVTYYQIACSLKPKAVEPKLGIAFPFEAMGNKNDLKAQYEAILTIDPYNTFVRYKLGLLYYEKKDYEPALQNFESVVNLYPFDYDGLLMYAWSSFQVGKVAESKALFGKVLCLSPKDPSAKRGLTIVPTGAQKLNTGK